MVGPAAGSRGATWVGGGGAVEDSAGMDSGEEATNVVKTGTRPKKDIRERKRTPIWLVK